MLNSCNTLNTKGVQRITTYSHYSKQLPNNFNQLKIVFISDLHFPSTLKEEGLALLIQQVNQLQPDLIVLGGDYTEKNRHIEKNILTVAQYLGQLKAPLGVFAVMGNHDNYNGRITTITALKEQGIKVLINQIEWVYQNESKIAIVGLDEPFWGHPNFHIIQPQLKESDFVLLLSHNPDFAEKNNLKPTSLMLSGHTHAGQITLGGWAPKTSSRYGQKYRYGLVKNPQDIPVIITSGIGTSGLNVRLGTYPEIVIITLKTAVLN